MPDDPNELSGNDRIMADVREHGGQVTIGRLAGSNLLIMTSVGARTGKPRSNPIGYTRDGDRYVLVGSNSGGSTTPLWVANVRANPVVTVEAAGETFKARATVTEGAERRRLLDAHQAAIPMFVKYEEMAEGVRELQVVALERIPEG